MLPTGALAVEASAEFGREDFIPSEIAQAMRRYTEEGLKVKPPNSKVRITHEYTSNTQCIVCDIDILAFQSGLLLRAKH